MDIRTPIGLLFTALGLLLVGTGLLSGPGIYETHSLGLNINLGWGLILTAFGVAMIALPFVHRRNAARGE